MRNPFASKFNARISIGDRTIVCEQNDRLVSCSVTINGERTAQEYLTPDRAHAWYDAQVVCATNAQLKKGTSCPNTQTAETPALATR